MTKVPFDPFRLLERVFPPRITSKIHDGTASSFLNAMVDLGGDPDLESVNAILSSFDDLKEDEQDKVIQSPIVSFAHAIHARSGDTDAKLK